MTETGFSFLLDLGNGIPENYISENRQHFDDLYVIDNNEYDILLTAAMTDHRIASMFKNRNGINQLDIIRAYLLWKNPDWIYIDADCLILKNLGGYLRSLPAFGQTDGHLDFFLIAGNGCGGYFNELLTIMCLRHPNECFPILDGIPAWYANFISPDCYRHDAATSTDARKKFLEGR